MRLLKNYLFAIFLLYVVSFLSACHPTSKPFGSLHIKYRYDSLSSHQRLNALRRIQPEVFDSAHYDHDSMLVHYRLFTPNNNHLKKYPLVVVFHGSGAIGTDNRSHLGVLSKLWIEPRCQEKHPSYVLAPQFTTRSSDYVLDSTRGVLVSASRPILNSVFQLIDSIKKCLNIDTNRIYVVGFSMGGSTVINALSLRPDLFAAGISVAGIPEFDRLEKLNHVPIWLIHGSADTENPIAGDLQFYYERPTKTRLWIFDSIEHNTIFIPPLLDETIPTWLFKQRRK